MDSLVNEKDESLQEANSTASDLKQAANKIQSNVIDDTELLGSVTTFPTSENDGPAVRTSARVIHKLRMDSTPLPTTEKKEVQSETSTVTQPKTPSHSKVAHVKVQWINQERNYFFDALNEHGRDFEQ